MSESQAAPTSSSVGPTLSFTFNLAKIPDQGEDSDPILREGPDLGLIAVFDGMGGAGGTVYETPDGPRTGAYLAARVARDVVERRMLDLLEPEWNLNGKAAAEDLRQAVREALTARLRELHAPPSGLRSKLLRALPTTMAMVALQRTQRGGTRWACHVLWTGDSRVYVFEPDGARQLSTDDIRDAGDAMANLRQDSVVSNAMSADVDFHVSYRRVELQGPFLIVCATDGCFGYVQSPMHFEHMVLASMERADGVEAWSRALQRDISAVTGDDAAMSLLGIGADLPGFQAMFAERVDDLEGRYTRPLDELRRAIEEAERELQAARDRHVKGSAELWRAYKTGYERHLAGPPVTDDASTPATPRGDTSSPRGDTSSPRGDTSSETSTDATEQNSVPEHDGSEQPSDAEPTP